MPRYYVRMILKGMVEDTFEADSEEAAITLASESWTMMDIDEEVDFVDEEEDEVEAPSV